MLLQWRSRTYLPDGAEQHFHPVRIVIFIDDYYPSTRSGAKLVHDLGVQLFDDGHEVSVVTPSTTVTNGFAVSVEDHLEVVRIKTGKLKDVSRLRRAWNEIGLSATLWKRGRRFFRSNHFDLIIYYSPTIFFGRLVTKLKLLWNCPAYLVLRDIFPRWAMETGALRSRALYRYFRTKELEEYVAADVIGVESAGNLAYFHDELAYLGCHAEVLANWTSLEEPVDSGCQYRFQLGLEGKVVFFYGGNIGVAQDMDNILRLAVGLKEYPHIYFLLMGEGSEVGRLNRYISAHNLKNIRLLPAVSQHEYLAMLREFDVGVISLHPELTTHNIPGKLLGYLCCGIPVLVSVNAGNDLWRLLEDAQAGLCCANGEDDKLREAALHLAQDADLRRTMGINARRLLEARFSSRAAANQILSHFQSGDIRTENQLSTLQRVG